MKKSIKKQGQIDVGAIESGRRVLLREIEGLQAVLDTLGRPFDQVVERILHIKGRLIISGMGKSGHIARKIAATFASTGTPAYFVHPGEASHGDLGMITEADGLLLLSNSGETAELHDIIAYAKRFSIPLMAMVRRESSMLVSAADVALVLPDIPEASPVNAPTTSTTMMLALGDALAVAVLERRGFTPEDFHALHPGGKLGKAFICVRDLMHSGPAVPLAKEKDIMSNVITDGDLRRHMDPGLLNQKAYDIMTRQPVTISPGMLAAEALGIMNTRSITSLFVVEKGKPVGILHVHDCLRAGIM
jgi:arabinose-5-phosphate isomerase